MYEEIVVAEGPKTLSPEEAKLIIKNIPVALNIIKIIREHRRNNVS